jgi:hypothetical protein
MGHKMVDAGRDETGCGRWSYLTYAAKEGNKCSIISAYRVFEQMNLGDITASK